MTARVFFRFGSRARARDWERRAWALAGFSGHGFKFGALIGEAVVSALTGGRSAEAIAAWAAAHA
jgi:glycine/D-amino acid oxidase-like deaminating enzyme